MSATWYGEAEPPTPAPFGITGWLRILIKGTILAVLVFGGLCVLLTVRLLERPVCGLKRPISPFITVFVCRNALRVIGLRLRVHGELAPDVGAVVANHSSWLDIFVLNAVKRVYFVSKAEVAAWPGIGSLARATGTVFIERSRARAVDQAQLFRARLGAGHRLLFFPEGTSSDGLRVLPFKSTLFAAFYSDELRDTLCVQPVSVRYTTPNGVDPRTYGWWGDMDFGPHFLAVLAAPHQGSVTVTYGSPLRPAQFKDRKAMAAACEAVVRQGHSSVKSPY